MKNRMRIEVRIIYTVFLLFSFLSCDDLYHKAIERLKNPDFSVYVSKSGLDTGSGSKSDPVLTIERGIELAKFHIATGDSSAVLIKVSQGYYTVNSTISVDKPISFQGGFSNDFDSYDPSSHETVLNIDAGATNSEIFKIVNNGSSFIKGFTLNAHQSYSGDNIIITASSCSQQVSIEDNKFLTTDVTNTNNFALKMTACSNLIIKNNIYTLSNASTKTYTMIRVDNSGLSSCALNIYENYAYLLEQCNNYSFIHITANPTDSSSNISVRDNKFNNGIDYNTYTNSSVTNSYHGILINSNSDLNCPVTVSGNFISLNNSKVTDGIQVATNTLSGNGNVVIQNNTVFEQNTTVNGSQFYGVSFLNNLKQNAGSSVSIKDNTLGVENSAYTIGFRGVDIKNTDSVDASLFEISENNITFKNSQAANPMGIYVLDSSSSAFHISKLEIKNNNILFDGDSSNCSTLYGIRLYKVPNISKILSVSSNNLHFKNIDNSGDIYAINGTGSYASSISSNTIRSESNADPSIGININVDFPDGDSMLISNNSISWNSDTLSGYSRAVYVTNSGSNKPNISITGNAINNDSYFTEYKSDSVIAVSTNHKVSADISNNYINAGNVIGEAQLISIIGSNNNDTDSLIKSNTLHMGTSTGSNLYGISVTNCNTTEIAYNNIDYDKTATSKDIYGIIIQDVGANDPIYIYSNKIISTVENSIDVAGTINCIQLTGSTTSINSNCYVFNNIIDMGTGMVTDSGSAIYHDSFVITTKLYIFNNYFNLVKGPGPAEIGVAGLFDNNSDGDRICIVNNIIEAVNYNNNFHLINMKGTNGISDLYNNYFNFAGVNNLDLNQIFMYGTGTVLCKFSDFAAQCVTNNSGNLFAGDGTTSYSTFPKASNYQAANSSIVRYNGIFYGTGFDLRPVFDSGELSETRFHYDITGQTLRDTENPSIGPYEY